MVVLGPGLDWCVCRFSLQLTVSKFQSKRKVYSHLAEVVKTRAKRRRITAAAGAARRGFETPSQSEGACPTVALGAAGRAWVLKLHATLGTKSPPQAPPEAITAAAGAARRGFETPSQSGEAYPTVALGAAGRAWVFNSPHTTVPMHIHLSHPSRDWRVRCTIGLSGWPSDMPAGRTQRLPVGLRRRHGRAAGLGVPTRVG